MLHIPKRHHRAHPQAWSAAQERGVDAADLARLQDSVEIAVAEARLAELTPEAALRPEGTTAEDSGAGLADGAAEARGAASAERAAATRDHIAREVLRAAHLRRGRADETE